MDHPQLLSSSLSFSDSLKQRINHLRCRLIKANHNTQFARNTPELADFRSAADGLIEGADDDTLSDLFQKTVQFTSYDAYTPFVDRFHERPCKKAAVVDLLAPGLPDFIVLSSSTTGGNWKTFPKYNRVAKMRSSDIGMWPASDPLRKRTRSIIWNLWYYKMDIVNEDNDQTDSFYMTAMSVLRQRSGHTGVYLDPERDEERMGSIISDHVAPYALGFVMKWRTFLVIHALFALGSRSLETIFMMFINGFVDMMRHLDAEYDTVVDCIANGTIPDLEGLENIRKHLESNISPDPERAEELRRLGRPSSRPGWCGLVWPNLRSVNAISSGSFAASVPLAQSYLGPNTEIRPWGYGSSEVHIGSPYDLSDLNLFRLSTEDVFEFLDLREGDSIKAIKQQWEVEAGQRYEIILTTQDGLWRYRLGDLLEIAGFDPTDGVPVIRFVQRNNVAMRFPNLMISEVELRSAMSAAEGLLPKIVNWTTTIDSRRMPETIGYFVELGAEEVPETARGVPDIVSAELSRLSPTAGWSFKNDILRKPTVCIVRPGTFSDFLQLKLDEGTSRNVGQVKVPVVLPKAQYVTWFLDQVVQEL